MFIEFKAIIFVHCGVNGTVQNITFSGFLWDAHRCTGGASYILSSCTEIESSTIFIKSICLLFKGYSTLGVHYRDLQARVHEQETRNLTAQPSAVLNFEFLVRERVLVNPIMHEQRVLKTF